MIKILIFIMCIFQISTALPSKIVNTELVEANLKNVWTELWNNIIKPNIPTIIQTISSLFPLKESVNIDPVFFETQLKGYWEQTLFPGLLSVIGTNIANVLVGALFG